MLETLLGEKNAFKNGDLHANKSIANADLVLDLFIRYVLSNMIEIC